MAASRPGIRPQLRRAPKRVAARFFQQLSGHAMIAPSLKEKWGWVSTEISWWCNKGRRSREHLSKERTAWTKEMGGLWTAVVSASGRREGRDHPGSRNGFGYRVRQARARPSNTSIRDLLSDDRYTETVLGFLEATRVGEVKQGVMCR